MTTLQHCAYLRHAGAFSSTCAAILATILAACGPGGLDDEGDELGTETGGECQGIPNEGECDPWGFCWAQHPDWGIGAHWHDPQSTQDGIDSGVLTPAPAPIESPDVECWRFGSVGDWAHSCRLSTECIDLQASPLDELFDANYQCSNPDGPWDYTVATQTSCYGVFDDLGLAVRLQQP